MCYNRDRYIITYIPIWSKSDWVAEQWQCGFEDLYYNFYLPYSSLRRKLPEPVPLVGTGSAFLESVK